MRAKLMQDGARWEAGSLGLTEFAARHPGADVHGLVILRERLEAAAPAREFDVEQRWDALRDRLPRRAAGRSRDAWRVRRSFVGALAIMLVGTSIAYAAAEPVRHGVNYVVRTVTHVFTGVDEEGPAGGQGQNDGRSGATREDKRNNTGVNGNGGTDGSGANGNQSGNSGPGGSTDNDGGSGSQGHSGQGEHGDG